MFRRRNKANNPSIYKDDAKLVERLLKEGADPNFIKKTYNYDRLPALLHALVKRHSEVIGIFKVLLSDPRTDINMPDIYGRTTLMRTCDGYAFGETGAELISILLAHPQIQINETDNGGTTALLFACLRGFLHVIDHDLFHMQLFKEIHCLLTSNHLIDITCHCQLLSFL